MITARTARASNTNTKPSTTQLTADRRRGRRCGAGTGKRPGRGGPPSPGSMRVARCRAGVTRGCGWGRDAEPRFDARRRLSVVDHERLRLAPGMAATRAADGAPRRPVQIVLVDEIMDAANRAGEYHLGGQPYRAGDPPRRASSRK